MNKNLNSVMSEIQMEMFKHQTLAFAFNKIKDSMHKQGRKKTAGIMANLVTSYNEAAFVLKRIFDLHVEAQNALRSELNHESKAAKTVKSKVSTGVRRKPKQGMAEHKASGTRPENKRNNAVADAKSIQRAKSVKAIISKRKSK